MKRFGLKAIAAALALTMVASLGVPASAKAEEKKVILIAPSPKAGNVLEVTQSMVDSEGELVLSGESFDKVVIPNDIEIVRLYVDGCEISELNIESGNNPEIQVWDSRIQNVTVVPAELIDVNKSLGEYLAVMQAQENAELDVNGFLNDILAKNKALSSKAPQVVLKGADMESSAQKIENLNLKGNAKLDCTEGKMPVALNVGIEPGQSEVSVTVKGFVGDMNVTQTNAPEAQFGILDVKAVDSLFENVNVAATGNGNVVLRSPDSVIQTVNYTSLESTVPMEGMLSLNIPASELVTSAEASNATINLLASVDDVKIDGKGVALNVGSGVEVLTATVAGQENSIAGSGKMTDCTIAEGSTASVVMPGASVAGNNTYVPVISVPVRPEKPSTNKPVALPDTPAIPEANENRIVITDLKMHDAGASVTENEDGSVTIKASAEWQSAIFNLADYGIDGAEVQSVKIIGAANHQYCVKLLESEEVEASLERSNGFHAEYSSFNAQVINLPLQVAGQVNLQNKFERIAIMSLPKNTDHNYTPLPLEVKITAIVFNMKQSGGGSNENLPDTVTVDVSGLKKIYGPVDVKADGDAMVAEFTGAGADNGYAGAQISLGDNMINVSDYPYVKAYGSFDKKVAFKVIYDGEELVNGNPVIKDYSYNSSVMDLSAIMGEKVATIEVSTNNTHTLRLEKIVFAKSREMLEDESTGGDEGNVGDSGEAETEIPVIYFAELEKGGYDYTASVVDGALTGTIDKQNGEIQYILPEVIDLAPYSQIVIEIQSDKQLDIKLVNPEAEVNKYNQKTPFVDAYSGEKVVSPHTIVLGKTDYYDFTHARNYKLSQINFMANKEGMTTFTLKSMTFVK